MFDNIVSVNLPIYRRLLATTILASLLLTLFFIKPSQFYSSAETLVSPTVVISQVYGGGGNSGSTYKNDFIELFNRGTTAQSLNGWSVQYASSGGTGAFFVTALTNVTLQPGQYYLVQEAAGTGGSTNLPAPDATGSIGLSASDGKVALVNNTTALSGTFAKGTGTGIIDFVGYGGANGFEGTAAAPVLTAAKSDVRAQNGCQDTDQNASDFAAAAVFVSGNPRNISSALNPCGGSATPSLSINDVALAEGNSGTTTFTFTVSLSAAAPAGGVTFDIATQNGTATVADNDYAAKSLNGQTIAAGASTYSFSVTVNGDTMTEANETFFVNVTNVTGATVGDGQGQGTINNDDVTLISINQIQGSGTRSPLAGQNVTTSGIVTAIRSSGFYIQTPDADVDGDSNTSEGIFVFTSTAPPAAAALGNSVQVSATVSEFVPSQDLNNPPLTELTFATTTLLSTGNPLPAPIVLTAAETTAPSETSNPLDTLEEYEGMRVQVNSLTVVAPTGGNVSEANATSSSTGVFFGVVTGVARPLREPGIEIPDPVPAPMPPNVPRFDTNPERIRVSSFGQTGGTAIDVTSGAVLTNLVGVLDYSFRTYTILPDPATPPTVTGNISAIPVPAQTDFELTVGSFNLERFFDTVNDPNVSDPVLTTTAFNNRLNKASLAIRNVLRTPDVLGVIEVENLSALQALANKINNDAVAAAQPNPNYAAYLQEGNDVGGIDVGFLVKSSKITVVDVTQFGKDATYTNPNDGTQDLLNDRPPLRLRATVQDAGNQPFDFTVIVNHLRSLSGVDDPTPVGSGTEGGRIRAKRRAQAEYLASLVQGFQTASPYEHIILVGDFNAFQINDGFVDVIGTIKGTPAPADQVVLPSRDLLNPNLIDLVDTLPADQRYSFSFDGNAQVLDHILVTDSLQSRTPRFRYARLDADFPESFRNDPNRPERISDHDAAVAYFSLTAPTAAPADISGRVKVVDFSRLRGRISLTLQNLNTGETQTTVVNQFGYYRFANLEIGNYIVTPRAKSYVFAPGSAFLSVTEDQTNVDFTAQPISK